MSGPDAVLASPPPGGSRSERADRNGGPPTATPRAVVLYPARMGQQERLMEVMEQIAAGRTSKLVCPFCSGAELEKGAGDYGPIFTCPACRRFIEAPNLDE